MELWVGTTNKGKLSEFKLLLEKGLPEFEIKTLQDLPSYTQPPENGKTFLENARIKAKSLKAMRQNVWSFAEDSGLEVEELGGLPGIHSARYAGPHARDSENLAKLLKMMQIKGCPTRKARFLCTMVAFDPAGNEHILYGELPGTIGKAPIGQMGFGYDPVFVPETQTKTLAELGPGFKSLNSHRAKATLQLIELIKSK